MAALPFIAMAFTALGEVQKSAAASASNKYNEAVAQQNQQITAAQGVSAAETQSRESQRRIGAATAAYGAAGVDLSTGSPLDALADSARMSTLDNLTLKYNYGLKGLGFENQATLEGQSAKNNQTAGYMNAAGALLGGLSRIPNFGAPSTPASATKP